jgi:hypothetical protein
MIKQKGLSIFIEGILAKMPFGMNGKSSASSLK